MARILISAGEASGDLYAGAVTRGIKQLNPEAEVFGMGGDFLREAGGEVLFDIKDQSVMGFVEIMKKLLEAWKLRSAFIELMQSWQKIGGLKWFPLLRRKLGLGGPVVLRA